MAENCTHDCSSCSSNCSSRKKESFLKAPNKNSSVKKVIGIVSGKGGVGKSFTTALLASYAQQQGKSVGIMDADITGPSIPHLSIARKCYPQTSPREEDRSRIFGKQGVY